jgi:signal transduction histidine kinase
VETTTNVKRHLLIIVLLTTFIIAQLTWWLIFHYRNSENIKSYQSGVWKTEIKTASQMFDDSRLSEEVFLLHLDLYFPDLEYEESTHSIKVKSDVEREFRKKTEGVVRMYLSEGSVFAIVIISGVLYVFLALRKQLAFEKQQSNFLSAVSHELKTPLTSLRMGFDTINSSKLTEDQHREISSFIVEDINRLDKLIQRLLNAREYGRKTRKKDVTPSNISSVVKDEIVRLQKEVADKKIITINTEIEDGIFSRISFDQLELVISNLVENSIKFSNSNSIVKVKLISEKSNLKLLVADSGVGFDKKEKKKIFRRFYRIGSENIRNSTGSGLGLYLAKEIVQNNSGKIVAHSDGLNQGSTFTVTLPIVKEIRVG